MKLLKFANGKEKRIVKEDNRFFFTEDAKYRKVNYASCVIEKKEKIVEASESKETAEEETPDLEKKPTKKSKKKQAEQAEPEEKE